MIPHQGIAVWLVSSPLRSRVFNLKYSRGHVVRIWTVLLPTGFVTTALDLWGLRGFQGFQELSYLVVGGPQGLLVLVGLDIVVGF